MKSTPMPLEDRVKKATAARVANAKRRRYQKCIGEMRADGLIVQVLERIVVDGATSYRPAADYLEA